LGGIYCKVASCGIIAVDGYINVCMKWQILQGQGFSTNSRCLVWNQRGAGGAERIWGGGASTSDCDISHRGSPIRPARWCSWAYCGSTALGSLSVICRQQHRDVSLRSGSCLPLSLPWCKNFAAFWAAPMFGPEDAGAGGVSAGFSPQKQDRFRSAGAQRARQGNGGQSAIHCIAAARQSFPSLVMLFWLSKGRRCRWRGRRRWLDHPLAGKRLDGPGAFERGPRAGGVVSVDRMMVQMWQQRKKIALALRRWAGESTHRSRGTQQQPALQTRVCPPGGGSTVSRSSLSLSVIHSGQKRSGGCLFSGLIFE